MTAIAIAALVILVGGIALAVYTRLAPRRAVPAIPKREGAPLQATTDWTNAAGDEFAGLSESARVDLVFAVGALDDDRSEHLLEHALSDPAEAVALAAAHVLASQGRQAYVDEFLAEHPGTRADRIAQALSLLDEKR
jgi:hypothetical protein